MGFLHFNFKQQQNSSRNFLWPASSVRKVNKFNQSILNNIKLQIFKNFSHAFLPSGDVNQWPADWPLAWTRLLPASFGKLVQLLGSTQPSDDWFEGFDLFVLLLLFETLFLVLFLFVAFFLEDFPWLNGETNLGSIQPPEASKYPSTFKLLDLFFPLVELLTRPFWTPCMFEAPPLPNCLLNSKYTKTIWNTKWQPLSF